MPDTAPLTRSQRLIWLGQQVAPESALYNMVWRIGLTGPLDPERFSDAFRQVAGATDVLRYSFSGEAGAALQTANAEAPSIPRVLDLRHGPDPQAEADAFIAADAAIPVDLTRETYRTRLIRISDEGWIWYFNQHHIVTDAAAGAIIWHRLVRAYEGQAPDPASAFAVHAAHEATQDASGALVAARTRWGARFADAPASAAIYGRIRDNRQAGSHRVRLDFGAKRTQLLKDLSADPRFRSFGQDLGNFIALATLFAAFLARTKGEDRVILGAPAHNRRTPDDKQCAGIFIEMMPLGIDIVANDSLATLYDRVRSEVMIWMKDAQPGLVSAAAFGATRAVLNYMPVRFDPLPGFETDVRWLHAGAHDGNQDVRLHVYDFNSTGAWVVEMDCKAELFTTAQAQDAASQFLSLFDAALAAPDLPLDRIALCAAEAPCASICAGLPAPEPVPVLSAFRSHVVTTPDAPALVDGAVTVTYRMLDAMSDAIAAHLRDAGVRPGGGVAVRSPRSVRCVAGILGVLKAGGFFVPVPPDGPPDRTTAILSDLSPDAELLGGGDGNRSALPEFGWPVLDLDTLDLSVAAPSEGGAGELAYVIYTSGSTGTPKGVEVTGDALARYAGWAGRAYGPQGPKSYAFCTSIGFDLTLTSVFVPLVTGGTVRIYPETAGRGPDIAVLDALADDRVDVVKLTPAHLAMAAVACQPLHRIGTLIVGGENLTTDLCRTACAALGDDLVIANEYGPTEAVVGCMIHRFDPARDTGASVPIGRAAEGVHLIIADAGGNPVPRGVAGELLIGGAGLARGYFRSEKLTAQKFGRSAQVSGGRFYRSGDLAVMRSGGVIEYLGRADDQIKVSGVRIEPAEIERALLHIPGISAATVGVYDPAMQTETRCCLRCGLSGTHPDALIDDAGLCRICRDYDAIRDRAGVYFQTPDDLTAKLVQARARRKGRFDAIMLLSGGKDSAYALYRLADLTRDVLVLTLDNGFISDGAKANIRRMTDDLGLEHRFMTTGAMNAIFRESLERFSNVCQGCFKTIYALALKVAQDEGIPAIVTGLSRGQFFETRLTPDLLRENGQDSEKIDKIVDNARRAYHRIDDAVSRGLNTGDYMTDALFDTVEFIDIYRYLDVPVSEIYAFLNNHAPWIRPGDTGRSTNCLINDAGIYVHQKLEGFHNYALPYSWDVRLGHKTRNEALEELDDSIDEEKVTAILGQIGFDPAVTPRIQSGVVAHVVAGADVEDDSIRRALRAALPREMVPRHIVRVAELPVTANGKIDRAVLPPPDGRQGGTEVPTRGEPPASPDEEAISAIFAEVIGLPSVDVLGNFYDLGGDSIAAIQIAMVANDRGMMLTPSAVFEHQTVRALARSLKTAAPHAQVVAEDDDDEPLLMLDGDETAAVRAALSGQKGDP